MLCKKKTLLSVSLSLLYFCLRTFLHLLAGEHCEMWFLDDMRPPVIWCIAFVLLYMSFLWIDYLLIDNLYRKGVFSKWFLILVIVCDIFFILINSLCDSLRYYSACLQKPVIGHGVFTLYRG